MAQKMTAAEAQKIAEALQKFGIHSIRGVDSALQNALKKGQSSPASSAPRSSSSRDWDSFFDNVDAAEALLSKIVTDPLCTGSPMYQCVSEAKDFYEYTNFMLMAEKGKDSLKYTAEWENFDSRSRSLAEIQDALSKVAVLHNAADLMANCKSLETKLKTTVAFSSDSMREIYDKYLAAKGKGVFDDLRTIKDGLDPKVITSSAVSAQLLKRIQNSMAVSREDAIAIFNKLLDLKGNDIYVDHEEENSFITCPSCGMLNVMKAADARKIATAAKPPVCPGCKKEMLQRCSSCKGWMPVGASAHTCGWNSAVLNEIRYGIEAAGRFDLSAAESHLACAVSSGAKPEDTEKLREEITRCKSIYVKEKAEISNLINSRKLPEAEKRLSAMETTYGISNVTEGLRKSISEIVRICQRDKFIADIERDLRGKNIPAVEKELHEATVAGFGDDTYRLGQQLDNLKEERNNALNRAKAEFFGGNLGSYSNAMKKVEKILADCPDFLPAKMWLKNNPRRTPVKNPALSFIPGENRVTISWEDDDSFVRYTVRREESNYPRDPDDGENVVSMTTNTTVTDTLPSARPGAVFYYSIFAVRLCDGQFVRTTCDGCAAWLPPVQSFQAEVDFSVKPAVVRLKWKKSNPSCIGVEISRREDGGYSDKIADTSTKYEENQKDCSFDDDDTYPGSEYCYTCKQVWKVGSEKKLSKGVVATVVVKK